VTLEEYLTVVNPWGSEMTVYRRNDLFPVTMKLDSTLGNSKLLSASWHERYIVFFIRQDNIQIIQVSEMTNQMVTTIAAIQSYVTHYAILDMFIEKGLFFVYAIKQVTTTTA